MKKLLVAFVFTLGLIACNEEVQFPTWDVELLAPLARTSFSISDISQDSIFQTNNDGTLSLVYKGDVYSLELDTLLNVPDTFLSDSFWYPIGGITIYPGPSWSILTKQGESSFNIQGAELNKVKIRSGEIKIEITSSLNERTFADYGIPSATKNGIPFLVSDTLPAASTSNPTVLTRIIDISGYTIDLRGINNNSFNTIAFNIFADFAPEVDTVVLQGGEKIRLRCFFNNVSPEYGEGFFGQQNATVEAISTPTEVFRSLPSGSLDLDHIAMTLTVKNGLGVDVQVQLNEITAIDAATGNMSTLLGYPIGSSLNVTRASQGAPGEGPIYYSEKPIEINSTTSNIETLLEVLPDSFRFGSTLSLNPAGNLSFGNDFVYYESTVDLNVDVEMPLTFAANQLTLVDTTALSFSGFGTDEELPLSGTIYLNCYNRFPFSTTPELILLDSVYNELGTIHTPGSVIQAAELNSNNRVDAEKYSQIAIPVNSETISNLSKAKYLYLKMIYTTSNHPTLLKLYSDYSLAVKVVGDFTVKVKVQ